MSVGGLVDGIVSGVFGKVVDGLVSMSVGTDGGSVVEAASADKVVSDTVSVL